MTGAFLLPIFPAAHGHLNLVNLLGLFKALNSRAVEMFADTFLMEKMVVQVGRKMDTGKQKTPTIPWSR
jgi:hypothetical protein